MYNKNIANNCLYTTLKKNGEMILKYSKESLCKQMSIVRQALYEISITLENKERDDEKILNLSREMDELILEYIKFGKED